MSNTVIKIENLSKLYQLGEIGTGTISHDLHRWWTKIIKKDDPYIMINEYEEFNHNNKDQVWALNNVNLEINKGDILGIIGKNGAGKSTLLKLISRITSPTTGSIKLTGKIASLLEIGTGMNPEMTARENIYLNGAILGMKHSEISGKIDEIIKFSGCEKFIDTPIKRFSSGMKVRLGFAVAAYLEPDIMIIDEVLAVGDVAFQKKCMGKMKDVAGHGRTVLFVSHNMSSIRKLCDSVLLIDQGKNIYCGEVNEGINLYLSRSIDNKNLNPVAYFKQQDRNLYVSSVQVISGKQGIIEYINHSIDIIFTLNISGNSPDLCLGFIVEDRQGNNIFTSSTDENEDDPLFDVNSKKIKLKVEIPGKILKPGRYYLTFSFRNKYGQIFHKAERKISFEIIDNNTFRGMKNLYRSSAIVAPEIGFSVV